MTPLGNEIDRLKAQVRVLREELLAVDAPLVMGLKRKVTVKQTITTMLSVL